MKINWIKHHNIDKIRYDKSIHKSFNGTVYALSWYLDAVSPGWHLLATPDYEYIMPLPLKKKLGIPYVIQPFLCQQLGLFSPQNLTPEIIDAFIRKLSVPYCYLQLNPGNTIHSSLFYFRPNYVLDIKANHEIIQSNYHKNTKAQLKKASKNEISVEKELNLNFVLQFIKENSTHYIHKIYETSCKVLTEASKKKMLHLWGVRDLQTNRIEAIASFIFWKNCFYYILPVSSVRGKQLQAMRFLVDRFIAEYAGEDKCIDFEGSAIPSVAQFYENFGAILKPYPVFEKNNFSFLIKLINK